ncbi:hypothetical protein K3N28_21095, partial [Glycomyces sp. TRM65418]|uniref:hypothetical protein n=1 Tax=Glycomyces sp. TRM65418 TaxID=2867006 RepID=UPI001D16CD97
WTQSMKPDLDQVAQAAEEAKAVAAMHAAKARCREQSRKAPTETPATVGQPKEPARAGANTPGDPPFLGRPLR